MDAKISSDEHTQMASVPKIELHLHLVCSLSYDAVSRLTVSGEKP